MSPEYYEVGPGFLGFVVSFALAMALWLLYRSFSKKLRRQKVEERNRAESVALAKAAKDPKAKPSA
jgi:hypothetical protein